MEQRKIDRGDADRAALTETRDELDAMDVPALKVLATSLGCYVSPNPRRSSLYESIRSKRAYDAAYERELRDRWLPPPESERSDLRYLAGAALALLVCGHRTEAGLVSARPGFCGYSRASSRSESSEDRLFADTFGLIAEVGTEQTARMIDAESKVPRWSRDSEPCELATAMIAEWVGYPGRDAESSYDKLIAPRCPADTRYGLLRAAFDAAEALHSRRETVAALEILTGALRDAQERKLSADEIDTLMRGVELSRVELECMRVEIAELRAQTVECQRAYGAGP